MLVYPLSPRARGTLDGTPVVLPGYIRVLTFVHAFLLGPILQTLIPVRMIIESVIDVCRYWFALYFNSPAFPDHPGGGWAYPLILVHICGSSTSLPRDPFLHWLWPIRPVLHSQHRPDGL